MKKFLSRLALGAALTLSVLSAQASQYILRAPEKGLAATANSTQASPSDPYFSDVSLLLHLDGTNGATTTTDSSSLANPLTFNAAQLSTSQFMFGPSSLYVGGSGYLSVNHEIYNSTGDMTIEMWVNFQTAPTAAIEYGLIKPVNYSCGAAQPYLYVYNSNIAFGYCGLNIAVSGPLSWTTGHWYHIAMVRQGNNFNLYRDGVQVGTGTNSVAFTSDTGYTIGNNVNAYIDEVRVTQNVARYTGNFTPPAATFPNQ